MATPASLQVLTSSDLFNRIQLFLPGVPCFVLEFKEREYAKAQSEHELTTPASPMATRNQPELTLAQLAIMRSNKRVLKALYTHAQTTPNKPSVRTQFDEIMGFAVTNALDTGFLDWIHASFPDESQRRINRNQFEKLASIRGLGVYRWVRNRDYHPPIAMMDAAATAGNLELVRFLHEYRDEPCTSSAMDNAAANGHLGIVQFLHENRQEGCTEAAQGGALKNGHVEVLRFLHENRSEGVPLDAVTVAARRGHLGCIKYAHENNFPGFTFRAMSLAMVLGRLEVVQFLHENRSEGCSVDALIHAWRFRRYESVDFVLSHRPMVNFDAAIREAKQRGLTGLIEKLERCETNEGSQRRFEYSEGSMNIH